MFGIIFVCPLVSTLLAVACFGILFFTHSQPVLNQLIWLEALFCFIILEHCAMIETHIRKKTVFVILGMAFVTIDIHLIEQFGFYLAKSIKILHNYNRKFICYLDQFMKRSVFPFQTYVISMKTWRFMQMNIMIYNPCMWYL